MSRDVVIVWKDKKGQLINTYRDEDNKVRVVDVDGLDEQQGRYVVDEADLIESLEAIDGHRLYVSTDLVRNVLGWDV